VTAWRARSGRLGPALVLAFAIALGAAALVWPSRSPGATTASAGGAADATAAPLDGSVIFRGAGCSGCHHAPGTTARIPSGPSLVGLAERAGTREPGLDAEAYVRRSVREPGAFLAPGFTEPKMPTLPLTEEELDAVVRYLLG
jgi:cytochrome c1